MNWRRTHPHSSTAQAILPHLGAAARWFAAPPGSHHLWPLPLRPAEALILAFETRRNSEMCINNMEWIWARRVITWKRWKRKYNAFIILTSTYTGKWRQRCPTTLLCFLEEVSQWIFSQSGCLLLLLLLFYSSGFLVHASTSPAHDFFFLNVLVCVCIRGREITCSYF